MAVFKVGMGGIVICLSWRLTRKQWLAVRENACDERLVYGRTFDRMLSLVIDIEAEISKTR